MDVGVDIVILSRSNIVINESSSRGFIQTQLRNAKSGSERRKGRYRCQYRLSVRQIVLDALHYFSEGEITLTIIGNDVN